MAIFEDAFGAEPLRDFEEFEGAELEVFQEAKGALVLAMDGLENSEVFEAASAEESDFEFFAKVVGGLVFLEIVGELSGCDDHGKGGVHPGGAELFGLGDGKDALLEVAWEREGFSDVAIFFEGNDVE